MLRFYFDTSLKYTNRKIIDLTQLGDNYTDVDYINIDSPDTINGHIIYKLNAGQQLKIPSYILELKEDSNGSYTSGVDSENNPVHYSLYRLWYVSGITQLNSYKFQISLLRDIISENPELWKNENAYITAGTATNYNKYKCWNLPYTNTKVKQERLNINGKSSFFVFYVNEQHENSHIMTEDNLQIKYTSIPGISTTDYTVEDLAEIPSIEYVGSGTFLKLEDPYQLKVRTRMYKSGGIIPNNANQALVEWTNTNGTLSNNPLIASSGPVSLDNLYKMEAVNVDQVKSNTSNSLTNFQTAINNWYNTYKSGFGTPITAAAINNLSAYIDKTILDLNTNKAYILRLESNNVTYSGNVLNSDTTTLRSAMSNITWPTVADYTNSFTTAGSYFVSYQQSAVEYTYTLEEIGTATTFDFNFKASVRKLPKSAVRCVNIVSDDNHTDEEIAQCLMLAQTNGINPDNTTGRILDIQYLPFSIASAAGTDFKVNSDYLTSQFLDLDDYYYFTNLTDLTNINKETDTIKIVSPSRASQFLFRPYDNDGNMEFQSKITLMPYTSTIYVRPSTKGLLIYDWDDKDCLIIQEDFSLTNVTSQWTNYVYSNKNYQNTFNRTIQGREFERTWERKVEEASLPMEQMNARNVRSQMISGISSGGGIFALAGAIGGLIGGLKEDEGYMNAVRTDFAYNQAMHEESISLATDQFNYQLENIKSQPLIPSKITTIDCKLLDGVYLEFYSTNPTELEAIVNFYRYNGNRIDSYGKFKDYWGWFIRGKIIISENYTQPEINELNNRLNLGIFTGEEFNND